VLWENVTEVEKWNALAFRGLQRPSGKGFRTAGLTLKSHRQIRYGCSHLPPRGVPCVRLSQVSTAFPTGTDDFAPSCSRLWPIPVGTWSSMDPR
jgi:hypothetical protein